MTVGELVTFGDYTWRILEIKDDQMLLITEEIIEQRDYHHQLKEITWKDSEIRAYLNSTFYQSFNENDRARILPTINLNPENNWYKSHGGEETKDYVFLLSMDEVVRFYFGNSSRLLDFPAKNQRYWFQRKDENNIKRRARYLNSSWWWWVRTPGKNNKVAVYIHGDGNIGIQGNGVARRNTNVIHPITNDTKGGVRPSVWIKVVS